MGSSKQPYLYEPVTHAPFNPKAFSQAIASPPPPKPKPTGPLISFNRHPDAWENKVYGRYENAKPMSSGTKKRIIWARRIQLGWRALQLAGSTALLVFAILIKGAANTQGWILRIPPALDLIVSLYAVWNLSRSPNYRPPASSASYHAFAIVMDICFIPFFAFTTILARNQWLEAYGTSGRWRTIINNEQTTNMVLQLMWLISAVIGGFHAITMLISIYLCLNFRKIAELPPDMNPLEDNLTSRTKAKHKYKNSDLSALVTEDKRFSKVSVHSEKTVGMEDNNNRSSGISFFSSRNGHDSAYNPHNPETAQVWHIPDPNIYRDPDMFYDDKSARSIRNNLAHKASIPEYGSSRVRSPMPSLPQISKRNSGSIASPIAVYDESGDQVDDNWEVIPPENELHAGAGDFDPYRGGTLSSTQTHGSARYARLDQYDETNLQPLRMNPPTPEPLQSQLSQPTSPLSRLSQGYQDNKENNRQSQRSPDRSQTMTSSSSSVYSESAPARSSGDSTPKSQYYPDLAAAMRGVRHYPAQTAPKSVAGSVHTHLSASTGVSSVHSRAVPATQGDLRIKPSGTVVRKQPLKSYGAEGQIGYTMGKASPSRVLSRSGVDVEDFGASGDLGVPNGRRGRREVSGKVAEEGRSGSMWRRISGRNPSR